MHLVVLETVNLVMAIKSIHLQWMIFSTEDNLVERFRSNFSPLRNQIVIFPFQITKLNARRDYSLYLYNMLKAHP